MINGNMVYRFLRAGPEGNQGKYKRYYVRRKEGYVTAWGDFKEAFKNFVNFRNAGSKYKLTVEETGPFARLGYEITRDNLCSACHQIARVGCCAHYSLANRAPQWRIRNMELVVEDIIPEESTFDAQQ